MTLLALIFLSSGLLIFALSLPLVRRKVPMNDYYGFRVAASFDSAARWYEINEYGARLLMRWSCPIVAIGLLGFLCPEQWLVAYVCLATAVCVLSVAVPTGKTLRYIRKGTGAPPRLPGAKGLE